MGRPTLNGDQGRAGRALEDAEWIFVPKSSCYQHYGVILEILTGNKTRNRALYNLISAPWKSNFQCLNV